MLHCENKILVKWKNIGSGHIFACLSFIYLIIYLHLGQKRLSYCIYFNNIIILILYCYSRNFFLFFNHLCYFFQATFQMCFTKWGHPPIGCCSTLLSSLLGKTGVRVLLHTYGVDILFPILLLIIIIIIIVIEVSINFFFKN